MKHRIPASAEWPSKWVDQILQGDSETRLRELPDNCIALAVTSPPYWDVVDYGVDGQLGQTSYERYLEQMIGVWTETTRVLIPNGKLAIVTPIMPIPKSQIGNQHTRHLKNIAADIEASILREISDLHRYSLFVWKKQTTTKMFGSYPYPPNIYEDNTIEFINVYVKDGSPPPIERAAKGRSKLSQEDWLNLSMQIWPIYPQDVMRAGGHPAPFPVVLPQRLIAMYTFAADPDNGFGGDIVLDMFNGSGATTLAASAMGRRWIGIDLHEGFCDYARRRLRAEHVDPGGILLHEHRVQAPTGGVAPPEYPKPEPGSRQVDMFSGNQRQSSSEFAAAD